ncbi:MAG: VanW family protein [Actinobacteria bacterium]|nr:VanW family protein [Actinomycetota bacterium]
MLKVFIGAIVCVVAFVGVGALALGSTDPGTIPPGVTAGGVELGGLDAASAAAVLEQRLGRRSSIEIDLVGDEGVMSSTAEDAGISLDVGATVSAALGAGSAEGIVDRLVRLVPVLSAEPIEVPVAYEVDEVRWTSFADEVALQFEGLCKNGRLVFDSGRPKAVAAAAGAVLERDALRSAFLDALSNEKSEVQVPLTVVEPTVTTEEARAALDEVKVALAGPLTLAYQGKEIVVSPEELAAMAEFNPSGMTSGLPFSFDTEAARELLQPRLAAVEDPPVEAVIVPAEGGRGFTVLPSSEGTLVEWSALLGSMTRVAFESGRRYVPIPTTQVPPRLTTEDANQLGDRREVASFTTYFSPADSGRVNNIIQVSNKLDGVVIRPGETFSFNDTVGPRTKEAGFDEAPVIRDGVLTPGVGGGICQVATTLFNTAFFAGLPIVERKPHSFYIDHYPIGRDATVSYGAIDVRFTNDSDTVLLLSVTATDRSVAVALAAPEWDRSVEYETSPFRDLVDPRSSEENPRRLRDPALARGTTSPVEAGVAGRAVEVRRVVRDSSGRVVHEDDFGSTYAPKDWVVRVGG